MFLLSKPELQGQSKNCSLSRIRTQTSKWIKSFTMMGELKPSGLHKLNKKPEENQDHHAACEKVGIQKCWLVVFPAHLLPIRLNDAD